MSDTAAPKARKTPVRRRKPATKQDAPAQAAATIETGSPVALIRVPLSVRWRDLDAFNHVNNSKYLSYLEEARLRWMLSVPGQGLDDDVAPVVAAANLNYRRPIEWPAEVEIELFVERLGNTSVTIGHRIVDAKDADVLFCDGNVVMVWIDRVNGRAAQLPEAVRSACT
ncbi:acyl-CoA thioesterase [Lysobacter panacisoli]|uniref:Thioesterase family protein n=1 Tax=Lysobacter panacisoli TaxID=1255263 RepID=A0ABP9LHA1_9GAMM|nr:thioesterase family protein [Lysobacter panacisoli]